MFLRDFMFLSERPLDANGELIRDGGIIVLSELGKIIERDSQVICSLLSIALKGKVRSSDFWRISVLFNHKRKTTREFVCNGGVVSIYSEIDAASYLKLDTHRKGLHLLDVLIECSERVFRHFNLPVSALHDAYEKLVTSPLIAYYRTKNTKLNNKALSAHIEVVQQTEMAEVFIVVSYKKKKM